MHKPNFHAATFIVALIPAGCGGAEPAQDTIAPTYHQDVGPIVAEHCASCHQPGAIGPGSLLEYAQIAARAPFIKQVVVDRVMPPWLAAPGCSDYEHNRALSDDDIATIAAWVDAGAPEGEASAALVTAAPPAGGMSRIDHTLSLPEAYEPHKKPDDYRCFLIDWPEDEVSFVTGFGVSPDNLTTVHHVIAFVARPSQVKAYEALDRAEEGAGYTCYGGPGGGNSGETGFLGAWAPGNPPADYPAGTGVRMEPGSKVILQVHYNMVTYDGRPDRSSIQLKVDSSVDREASWAFFANPAWVFGGDMPIPAGDPDVEHSFALDVTAFVSPGRGVTLYEAGLHMHTHGVAAKLDIVRQNGNDECVLDIPRWDFDWQFPYRLTSAKRFEPGDQLRIGCRFDNSPTNQPIVDGVLVPPRDITWGEGTDDEMCLGMLYIVPDP